MPQKNRRHLSEMLNALSKISQMGLMVAACLLVGVLLGKFLDGLFGTSPWLVIIFSLLGAGAAFKSLFDFADRK